MNTPNCEFNHWMFPAGRVFMWEPRLCAFPSRPVVVCHVNRKIDSVVVMDVGSYCVRHTAARDLKPVVAQPGYDRKMRGRLRKILRHVKKEVPDWVYAYRIPGT